MELFWVETQSEWKEYALQFRKMRQKMVDTIAKSHRMSLRRSLNQLEDLLMAADTKAGKDARRMFRC